MTVASPRAYGLNERAHYTSDTQRRSARKTSLHSPFTDTSYRAIPEPAHATQGKKLDNRLEIMRFYSTSSNSIPAIDQLKMVGVAQIVPRRGNIRRW
jgi:hypothetical protein